MERWEEERVKEGKDNWNRRKKKQFSRTKLKKHGRWMIGGNTESKWTRVEGKVFAEALGLLSENKPDRWEKIAGRIPGKSLADVRDYYDDLVHDVIGIDSGRVELTSVTPTNTGTVQLTGTKTDPSSLALNA
ncbi:hypothetical protein Nepgr_009709 [Nepenthes gracilis]|uniref:Myb-like domain-containing protein n=1 Tax=Nepenthes gracilis TaxID=150966 RepID=A0AAD3SBV0_NEPGR|nr:hypothetical protein Nepgr_009709 [Nepenthes gracilis]